LASEEPFHYSRRKGGKEVERKEGIRKRKERQE